MAKGSSFEREFCKTLTAWWTGDPEHDVIYWRTAGSGGRATFRRGKSTHQAHCGDVASLGKVGSTLTKLITFELKRGYNKATANDVVDRPPKAKQQTIEGFIEQAMRSAIAAKTPYWSIVHKRDKRQPVIYMPMDLFERLVDIGCFDRVSYVSLFCEVKFLKEAKVSNYHVNAVAVSLADFLACVDPQDVKFIYRQVIL